MPHESGKSKSQRDTTCSVVVMARDLSGLKMVFAVKAVKEYIIFIAFDISVLMSRVWKI